MRVDEQLAYHASLLETIEDAVVGTDPEFRLTVWNSGAQRLYGFTAEEVLGRDARTVATNAGDESRPALERELSETGRVRTEITAHRKDGTPVEVELIAVAVRDEDGTLTGYLGIHRDMTERKRAEEELARRAHQQGLVADLGLWALARQDLQDVMDEAVTMVARGLDITPVGIAEILHDTDDLRLRAGVGWREGAIGIATGAAGRGSLVGYTILAGEPVTSEDVVHDARFEISGLLRGSGVTSAATVVIAGAEGPYGVLGVFPVERRSFSRDDVNFLQAVANVVAAAVERVGAEERVIEVREAERRRIARDLHDEALQDLTDALAQAITLRHTEGGAGAASRVTHLIGALQHAGEHVRGAIYDLRLGGEDARPFRDLLVELVEVQQAIAPDVSIELDIQRGVTTGSVLSIGTEVLRIAGEALVNARRHSGAANIRVEAAGSKDCLSVEISDDGGGFDIDADPKPHATGLTGMRERADLIGGELEIRSEIGAGTTVRLTLGVDGDVPAGQDEAAKPTGTGKPCKLG